MNGHFLIEPEQAFQAVFVIRKGIARITAFYDVIQSGMGFAQVLRHLVWVIQVGKCTAGIVLSGNQHFFGCFLYSLLFGSAHFGEGE